MVIKQFKDIKKYLQFLEDILMSSNPLDIFPLYDPEDKYINKYNSNFFDMKFKSIENINSKNILFIYNSKKLYPLHKLAAKIFNATIIEITELKQAEIYLKDYSPKYTYLFTDIDCVNHKIFNEYQKYITDHYSSGIITAKDIAALSWFLLKSIIDYDTKGAITVLPRESKKYTESTWIKLTQKSEMLEEIRSSFAKNKNVDIFSISSHGTEDCISLKDGIICGKSCDREVEGLTCIPGESCPVNENAFMCSKIKSKIVFNNTCMGLRLNDTILPLESNITHSSLEGFAQVYISPNRVKYGPDSEVCLFNNLVKYGYSVGDSIRIINTILKESDYDFNSFFIVGNPQILTNEIQHMRVEVECINKKQYEVKAKGYTFFEIKVDKETYQMISNIAIKSKQEIFFSKYYDYKHDIFKVLIYSWDKIENDCLIVDFISKDQTKILEQQMPIENWVLGLERYISGKNVHPRFTSLYNMFDKLAKYLEKMKYDTSSYIKASTQNKKIIKEISEIQKKQLESLLSKATSETSIWMPDAYMENTRMIKNLNHMSPCFICKTPSKHKVFEHRVTGMKRELVYCPRCGGIHDNPCLSKIEMTIKGINEVYNTSKFTQVLSIKNYSSDYYKGFVGLRIDSVKKHNVTFNPSIIDVDLGPNEEDSYEIEIHLNDNVKPHLYYLKALSMLNMNIYYSNKPLFIKGYNNE